MLESFTLKNFKSFKDATLHLTSNVTFLIGANASGKTNAIEALRMLHYLGQGKRLEEIEREIGSDSSVIRGPSTDIIRRGENSMEFNVHVTTVVDGFQYSTAISFKDKKARATLNFTSEKLTDANGKEIYSTEKTNPLLETALAFSTPNGLALFYGLKVLTKLIAVSATQKTNVPEEQLKKIAKGTAALLDGFSKMFFWNFQPEAMRGYRQRQQTPFFEETGKNLSAILEQLCQEPTCKKGILDFVKDLPEQDIKDISFSITDAGYVMVQLEESFHSSKTSMTSYSLSDGTLRVLAIAAALYSVGEGSLVVIEEVDNGIHPSRIPHLVDKMYEIAKERHIQILVTTHDPAMMDAIPPQEKGNVLCCYRSKKEGCSAILRLKDSPNYMDFLTNGRLGSFVATDLFDKLVRQTEEERQKEHAAWSMKYQKEQREYYERLQNALKEE